MRDVWIGSVHTKIRNPPAFARSGAEKICPKGLPEAGVRLETDSKSDLRPLLSPVLVRNLNSALRPSPSPPSVLSGILARTPSRPAPTFSRPLPLPRPATGRPDEACFIRASNPSAGASQDYFIMMSFCPISRPSQ